MGLSRTPCQDYKIKNPRLHVKEHYLQVWHSENHHLKKWMAI